MLHYKFEEAEKPSVIDRSGLLLPGELMDQMELLEFFDHCLPKPKVPRLCPLSHYPIHFAVAVGGSSASDRCRYVQRG